jgi:hypothetical protein
VTAHDRLREAIQGLLNESGDGFILAHYVVVLGIQRVNSAGEIVSAAWVASPKDQADYVTDGLLAAGEEMRANCDLEFDDDD